MLSGSLISRVVRSTLVPTRCAVRLSSESLAPAQIIITESDDILLNLATEEWLFEREDAASLGPTLMLWRNSPTIVIGAGQNPWKECNMDALDTAGVTLARRRSGGGAVYQDLGNTCFSFLGSEDVLDRSHNNGMIIEALAHLGFDGTKHERAVATGRNDITVGGRKVSGAAFKKIQGVALHHGTMLIRLDLNALGKYLSPHKLKLLAKGVKSAAARVVNLTEIEPSVTHEAFCEAMQAVFTGHFESMGRPVVTRTLTLEELSQNDEVQERFNTLKSWDWRFGKTPSFTHNVERKFDWALIDLHIDVKHGEISDAVIYTDALFPDMIEACRGALIGTTYSVPAIEAAGTALADRFGNEGNPTFAAYSDELFEWVASEVREV